MGATVSPEIGEQGGHPPQELRLAVAMNGGVSLAVWIGGVAYELARAAAREGDWPDVLRRPLVVDVLAGTSAGGINAAFLALSHCYGVDLEPLRELWLDTAGLEPRPGAPTSERPLLRSPDKGAQSLLDGKLFYDRLEQAFTALLGEVSADGPGKSPKARGVDLRLTTTSHEGRPAPFLDDLGSSLHERSHRASFHFIDGDRPHTGSLRFNVGDHGPLARQLARASRATASFPFAFEPSQAVDEDERALGSENFTGGRLLDGGVLNNLPVDHAIEAIFSMRADEKPERWLVAVVPDPAQPQNTGAGAPLLGDIVLASLMGIPRNQTVKAFIDNVRERNAVVAGRSDARRKLLGRPVAELMTTAETLYPSYQATRRAALARQLSDQIAAPGRAAVLDALPNSPLPHLPETWPAEETCWDASVLRRHVAVLLRLHSEGGAPPAERGSIHEIRNDVGLLAAFFPAPDKPNTNWRAALDQALLTWPLGQEATAADVAKARAGLTALSRRAGEVLVDLAVRWEGNRPCPATLAALARLPKEHRQVVATCVLEALEIVQGAFSPFEHDPEQQVNLGFLTPRLIAPLDPNERSTSEKKLAGDELGHFGAFLKRSWRANDWMWGRLDAASFLFKVIERSGSPVPKDAQLAIQRCIVEDEGPFICAAVNMDRDAGAASPCGEKLVGRGAGRDLRQGSSWSDIVRALRLDEAQSDPHQEFLSRCRIGEEKVRDELWSSLTARVGLRAAATTLTVARGAGLPVVQGVLNKALAPVRVVAVVADRYAAALRPRQAEERGLAWVARLATEALAGLAFLDLAFLDLGQLAPFVWLALAGMLLTIALTAPLTTLLLILCVCGLGLLSAAREEWRPDNWPTWLLPLDRLWAFTGTTILLTVISSPKVDRLDRFLRGVLSRAQETAEALGDRTG